jgi:TolB protein
MKIKSVLLLVVIIQGICFAEQFDLEVYASKFDSIPIGVVEFKSSNSQSLSSNQPWQIIANDLDFCGKFVVSSRDNYDSAAFASVNVGIYIDGDYTIDGSNITINCNLRDVASKELIIGKKYKGSTVSIRTMMHKYSNEIVEMLFGDKGIFESRVTYVSTNGNQKQISVMDFDGYNQVNVTKNKVINLFPAFADKNSIIWTSYLKGRPNIFRASLVDGVAKPFLLSKAIDSSPDVSPVDGTIVFASSRAGNLDIYTCNADATGIKPLTVTYGVDTAPSWSANGYQIAFTSDRSGNPQIYVMDKDGANQRRLTFSSKWADSPAWSPKGDKIAYMSMGESSLFDIWIINVDGTGDTKVTTVRGNNEYPTWSPDGNLIGFTNSTGARSDFYIVKPDGTHLKKVTTSGDVKQPYWSGF